MDALPQRDQEGLCIAGDTAQGRLEGKLSDLDPVFKALADPTRRAILDLPREGPRTTTEIVRSFPRLTRFGVMKHIDVLRGAGLVNTRESGRLRVNSLNAVPIRRVYERWVSRFEEFRSHELLRLKENVEEGSEDRKPEPPQEENL